MRNDLYGFEVKVLNQTQNPQTAIYLGMHQCYSSKPAKPPTSLTETGAGHIITQRLLEGNRGHYSPFEQAVITFGLQFIPHSVLQQLLRSRIGVSPSVQSFRYTSDHLLAAANGSIADIEKVIYLRPCGIYHDRESRYEYTQETRQADLDLARACVMRVAQHIQNGMPPEQARSLLTDYRQHAVITFNARSLMGFFDRRTKKDAQIEIRELAVLMYSHFTDWMPEVAEWYTKHRLGKAMLAP